MTNLVSIITAVHLAALGQIEGGSDDLSRPGPDGEITRYQILPAELHRHGYGTADVEDRAGATLAARDILQRKVNVFIAEQRRAPTGAEIYLLWHRPARVLHPRPKERERAERYASLVADLESTRGKGKR